MMKVTIENFQSIEKVELELEGFTVLVGRSSIGKSAIIRAIEGAFINKLGDSFVRHGESSSLVRIQCPEIDLTWKKGGGHNDYWINGEEFTSVGRGPVPKIKEAGFYEIETHNSSVSVQTSNQFQPIFLLDPSTVKGSAAAEIISDIGRVGELQEALTLASKDKRSKASEIKVREKDLKKVEKSLADYQDLDSHLALWDEVQNQAVVLEKQQTKCETLRKLSTLWEETENSLKDTSFVENIHLPSSSSLEDDLRSYDKLIRLEKAYSTCCCDLENLPKTLPIMEEIDLTKDLKKLQSLSKFHEVSQETLETLESLPTLEGLPESPDELSVSLERLSLTKEALHLQENLADLESELGAIAQSLKDVENELHELKHDAEYCPLCESKL